MARFFVAHCGLGSYAVNGFCEAVVIRVVYKRARRELRFQNDEGAEGGEEITRSGACLPRWYLSQP